MSDQKRTTEILQNAEKTGDGGIHLSGEDIAVICDEQGISFDMVLPCPKCGEIHVDAPDPENCKNCGLDKSEHNRAGIESVSCPSFSPWVNAPHKKHRCANCNEVWKPYPFNTNGIAKPHDPIIIPGENRLERDVLDSVASPGVWRER